MVRAGADYVPAPAKETAAAAVEAEEIAKDE